MSKLSLEEQATNYDTMKHIRRVQALIHFFVGQLLDRADVHDNSKLEAPEVEYFTKHTENLCSLTYGSEEYNKNLAENLQPALDHHYANNRHHPQHFKNGIDDMNLLDLLEMFADWKAASERHNDGNIRKSIEHNGGRFQMSPQLVRIFENTADIL
jgi:hypothetical protein